MKYIIPMIAAFLVCAWTIPNSAPAQDYKPDIVQVERAAGLTSEPPQMQHESKAPLPNLAARLIAIPLLAPPRTLMSIVLTMCLGIVGAWLLRSKPKHRWRALERIFGPPEIIAANIGELTHDDSITLLADATSSTRYLLVKVGSDANHYAIAGATDLPIGTQGDEPAAIGDEVVINLLGHGPTKKMVASEAMATTGVKVFAAASGKIALGGSVLVGTLLSTGAADGSVVEVQDCVPQVIGQDKAVAATRTVLASENGATFFFGHATEFVMTLPAPFAGARFSFICTAAPASASYTIVTAASANIIHGVGLSSADAGGAGSSTAGTPADTITFVDGQAKVGDRVDIVSDGTAYYAVAVMSDEDGITFTVAS